MKPLKQIAAFGAASVIALTCATAVVAETKTLRITHEEAGDAFNSPPHACASVFANIVNADTNGSINVEVYPSDQLGSNEEAVQMTQDNTIQAVLASTGSMATYYPNIDVLNLVFAYDHNAATYDVFDGAFGKALAQDIKANLDGVEVLGFPDSGGFFAVTNSKRSISSVEDFDGIRIRTMTIPSHKIIINALNGEAYPLAWGEVYSGLQTGVIDGQMNPVPIIANSNFAEVQDHLTLTNHLFSPYTFLLSDAFWDSLSDDEKRIVRYAAESCVVASRGISRIIEASDRGLPALKAKMEVVALTQKARDQFKALAQPAVIEHLANTLGDDGKALLEVFQSSLEEANAKSYLD
ncbi:MAG: DctP family TRAP transporter solute-binding subunit [Rhodobacteraceae bacterium]|nr:DctP family TRAP transporter solute-binding subunit [Paracoccaceae bacterium]